MEKIKFMNTAVTPCSMDEALYEIESLLAKKPGSYVVAVNTDVVMKIEKDALLKKIVEEASLVLVDGKPLIWIAKKHKLPIREKVSGSDLVPKLCEIAADKGYTIFLLGGKEGVAKQAQEKLRDKLPTLKIVGEYAPPVGFEKDPAELDRINSMIAEAHPDILLACLGCPKQERFVYENRGFYHAKISVCAGATIDFLAGNIKRAPKWMSNCGLEWLYRFFKEPRRLFKRYFIDDMKIFRLARKYNPKKQKIGESSS